MKDLELDYCHPERSEGSGAPFRDLTTAFCSGFFADAQNDRDRARKDRDRARKDKGRVTAPERKEILPGISERTNGQTPSIQYSAYRLQTVIISSDNLEYFISSKVARLSITVSILDSRISLPLIVNVSLLSSLQMILTP